LLSHVHSACRFGNLLLLLLLLSCCCQLHCGSQLVISYLVFSCGLLLQLLVLLHTNRGKIINIQKLICKARSRSIARNLRRHKECGFG
jgi:hypothetical protein